MRFLPHLALGLAMTSLLPAQELSSPTTLAQLRDRYRPLLLFASRPDDPSLLAQMTRLKDAAPGLAERDVLVIAIPYKDPAPTEVARRTTPLPCSSRGFHGYFAGEGRRREISIKEAYIL